MAAPCRERSKIKNNNFVLLCSVGIGPFLTWKHNEELGLHKGPFIFVHVTSVASFSSVAGFSEECNSLLFSARKNKSKLTQTG